MNAENSKSPSVAVIGGGITGLAAAHRLGELDPHVKVTLLEGSGRLGGVLETVQIDGFSVERSGDNFITTVPWGLDLCRRIGFESQLVTTSEKHRGAMVVHNGRLKDIPEGFLIMAPSRIGPLLSTSILSPWGKLRLAAEWLVPRKKDDADESMAAFVTRRLGRQTYERLVQPLVGGIYAADPRQLSLQATLPRFLEMERKHGSLIRAALRQRKHGKADRKSSGARYSMFVAPRDGLSSMVQAIADRLPPTCVELNTAVQRMVPTGDRGWSLSIGGDAPRRIDVDAVILAIPAHGAAPLLTEIDSELAGLLDRIPHGPYAIVSLGYRRDQISHPLSAFGFVVPLVEGRQIASGSFSSVKYPGRAPEGCELFRVFLGGACQAEIAEFPDDQLRSIAEQELGQLLGIQGPPIFDYVCRWTRTMPHYLVGHCDQVIKINERAAALPPLRLAGNAYHGIGIPHCIHSGEKAAEDVLEILGRTTVSHSADAPG